MKLLKNKNRGILFWVTGLSGAGKTTIAEKIRSDIQKHYGPTLVVSGDNIRKIFNITGYSYDERVIIGKNYLKFAKFVTNQKINLIFAAVGMMHSVRKWGRKNIDNYVEIYIKADLNKIIKLKKKKFYHKKKMGDVYGVTIKPEFPNKPNIIVNNSFKKNTNELAKDLAKKILKII